MNIIFIFVGIIFIIQMYVTNNSATKNKSNVLLSVTLPLEGLKNNEVLEIVKLYKKANIKCVIISAIAFVPILFMPYISFLISYLFLWIIGIMYGSDRIFKKYNEKLMNLKRENDWFMPSKHLITIDTEVSRLKDEMVISKLWFIPSIIISIIPIILSFSQIDIWGSSIVIIASTSIISTIIFMWVYKKYSIQRCEVFTEDTKTNLACNIIYKKMWTTGCVLAATIQSISMLIVFVLLMIDSTNELLFMFVVIVPVMIVTLGIYYINNKVRSEQNRLVSTSENPIYTDNDEYWKNDVYNNPNDRRTMIEKRVGYGLTWNVATKKGKIMTYSSYVFAIILPVFIIGMFFIFDFTKFKLDIDNNIVKISAPVYGTTFKLEEIEEIKMIDNMPKLSRTNGVGAETYSLGNYSVNEYGKSKLYIYNDNPPYIAIKLKNEYVFINGENQEETKDYYEELISTYKKDL